MSKNPFVLNVREKVFKMASIFFLVLRRISWLFENRKIKRVSRFSLSQKHIKDIRVLLNRLSLLELLPKGAICAEIGVDRGDFSKIILEKTHPQKLHLIDAWGDNMRYDDGLKELVKRKFKEEIKTGLVEVNVGYSTDILKKFPDQYFDWVYLDTDHTYKTTASELRILKDKVKKGGIIAGHDYIIGNWYGHLRYGVIEAVHEFCIRNNWQLKYITQDLYESPSFAIKKIK